MRYTHGTRVSGLPPCVVSYIKKLVPVDSIRRTAFRVFGQPSRRLRTQKEHQVYARQGRELRKVEGIAAASSEEMLGRGKWPFPASGLLRSILGGKGKTKHLD